jgi:cell division protein FtsI (penicillin-binding protein 3)
VLFVGAMSACNSPPPIHGGGATASTSETAATLDPKMQGIAREEIDHAVAEWKPTAAFVVILDAATGFILAMEGRDQGREDRYLAFRRALVTGSTLKTFTIAAALDARTIDINAHVDCATRLYGEAKLFDSGEHESLSVTDVLAVSSNVGTSRIYDTIGLERLLATLRHLHIGDPPASLPVVPDPSGIQAATLAAGELAKATPLQVAAGYAAIFNDGVYLKPSLTRRTQTPEPVLRPETARTVTAMLETITKSELGTGKLARIEGARVAGKTGTGDLGDDRSYASFVGTVLDWSPRIVVLVGLEAPREGGSGPSAAAPTFARIARRLIGK